MQGRNLLASGSRPLGIALTVATLMAAGIAVARSTITPYTLTETNIGTVDPGQWSFLPSGNIHVRDRLSDVLDAASDPRVSGKFRVATSANLDANWMGPTWGTFHGEIGGGVWDGTWNGNFNFQTGSGDYDAVGHGSSAFDGLQLMEHCVYVYGVGTCTGRILDTKGQ